MKYLIFSLGLSSFHKKYEITKLNVAKIKDNIEIKSVIVIFMSILLLLKNKNIFVFKNIIITI